MRKLLRKTLALLQSRRAYVVHLEPELREMFRSDAAWLGARLDLFKPLIPLPVPPPDKGPLLVLGAHPDDEAVGPGGTLLLARRKGVAITLAFLTDGRPGRDPGGEAKGRIRRDEARAAAETLGGEALFFKAPVRSLARDRALAGEAALWLGEVLDRLRPRHIFCPFPLDAHSDHRIVAWALARAVSGRTGGAAGGESLTGGSHEPIIWAYEVASLCPANVVVEISGVAGEKRALIETYSSQTVDFGYANVSLGLNRYHSRHLEGRGAAEAFFRIPAGGFAELMESLPQRRLFKDGPPSVSS